MNNKEKNFVSAVVYLYNEESNIQAYILGLEETLKENFEKYEIIVVNDASTDNSVKLLRAYVSSQEGASVTLMNMGFHQGLETAMGAGVDLAIGDFVFEMESAEADYRWDVLMAVYHRSLEGYDIVNARGNIGNKFTIGSLFYKIMNRYANLQYPLASGSFRIVSRRAINRIHSLATQIPYRKVAYSNCGLKCDTLLYDFINTKKTRKYSNRVALATNSLVLFTDVAFRFTFWFTIVMIIFTLGMIVYHVASLIMNNSIEGWSIALLFVSFALSGLFVVLSMVIRYLSTLVKLNFLKKAFIFESIDKLQK
jgi:dolichol-phosphate mannosyltransferase